MGENLPKFFKDELFCESPDTLWDIVERFIKFHTCNNANASCTKVTYLKCSNCRFIYYCSKQCQIEDWPRHKLICQDVRSKYMDLEKSRVVIQSYILNQASSSNVGSLLTFKVFLQEIERSLFTAYLSVIEQTNSFDDQLNENFENAKKTTWVTDIKSLQRKRYRQLRISAKKFESQMISVFKTKSVFPKYYI